MTNPPLKCCDGECNHDDCCGKIPENCTHPTAEPKCCKSCRGANPGYGRYVEDYGCQNKGCLCHSDAKKLLDRTMNLIMDNRELSSRAPMTMSEATFPEKNEIAKQLTYVTDIEELKLKVRETALTVEEINQMKV